MPWSLDGNAADFMGSLKAGQLFRGQEAGGQAFRVRSRPVIGCALSQGRGLGPGCLPRKQALRRATAESCYLKKKKKGCKVPKSRGAP